MSKQLNSRKQYLVLALGNWYQQDDAIALVVLEKLKHRFAHPILLRATEEAGLSLLDLVVGFQKVVLLDAIITSGVEGEVVILTPEDFHIHAAAAWHQMGIPEMLQIGKELKLPMPQSVYLIGITVNHCNWGEEGICPVLRKSLPQIENACESAIRQVLVPTPRVEEW